MKMLKLMALEIKNMIAEKLLETFLKTTRLMKED